MSVPSTAYAPTKGAHLAVLSNNRTMDALTSASQLLISEHWVAASRLGLQDGNEQYRKWQLRHAGHFAILSANLDFNTNCYLATLLKWTDLANVANDKTSWTRIRLEHLAAMRDAKADDSTLKLRGNMRDAQYRALIEWDQRVDREGITLEKLPAESWSDYRTRLMTSYGVSYKVASFICLLLYPTKSDVATIDTWMASTLGFIRKRPTDSPTAKQYKALEAKLRAKRDELGMTDTPLGLFQWMCWSFARGQYHNHAEASLV